MINLTPERIAELLAERKAQKAERDAEDQQAAKEKAERSAFFAKIYAEKHMSTDSPRRIVNIVLEFDMPQNIPLNFRSKLKATAVSCPVKQSMHPDVAVDINFRFPD